MSILRISIRYSSIILIFLASLLGYLGNSQGQINKIYNCTTFGQSCLVYTECPNATQIIQSRKGRWCGNTNDKPKPLTKICCSTTTTSTSTTTKASTPTKLTNTRTSTTTKTPPPLQTTPTVRLQPTTSRNATAVALEKCREYGQYRYTKVWVAGQRTGDEGYWSDKQECVNVHTLILGGARAQAREYPHMALIGYGNKFSEVQWGCGGTLISERFVMSAAHCGKTTDLGPARWALLGDLTLSKKNDAKPVTYSIINIYDHPQYVKPSYYHDISLFELNTTVILSTWVRPACLHTSLTDLTEGARASITGWGRTHTISREPINDSLLKASISIVADRSCKASYNAAGNPRLIRGYDTNTMICAADFIDGNDTCTGDSGGPLQIIVPTEACMWDVIGVTSFGPNVCGNGEDPGVYTKVAYYLDWIQKTVWP